MTAPDAPPADPTAIEARRIAAWTIDLAMFLLLLAVGVLASGGLDWTTRDLPSNERAIEYCQGFDGEGVRTCVPVGTQAVVVEGSAAPDLIWIANSLFYVLLQGLTGGSVGKLLLGLRVVDERGQIAGVWKSFLRTLLWIVDAITCFLPVIGGLLITTTRGHRRVGDMVAGTFVVRKESVGVPVTIPPPKPAPSAIFQLPPPGYAPPPGYGTPPGTEQGSPPMYPPPQPPPPTGPPTTGWYPEPVVDRPLSRPSVDAPDTDGPHWDDDRDTYIQYDRAVEMWVQWDERNEHWRPIDT